MAESQLYTCISCAVAFSEPALQRQHFASDWHRYNMKRRVATLPPVSAVAFNQKVIERREQTAVRPDPKGMACEACKKAFLSENAYRSHMASKKHQERDAKFQASKAIAAATAAKEATQAESSNAAAAAAPSDAMEVEETPAASTSTAPHAPAPRLFVDADATEEDVEMSIEAKIAAARSGLTTSSCLFCTHVASSLDENLQHMSAAHSFFIPDQEYLVDVPGLITYLGEKLAIGNTCLYCPNGGKEFGSLAAVRAHMKDKAHCKIAYDTEDDKLEISDYYDFEESYPDANERRAKRAARKARRLAEKEALKKLQEENDEDMEEEEWEEMDEDDGEEPDEVVVVEGEEDDSDAESDISELSDSGVTLAPDGLSLRLPSGRTLGHKSLRIYYNQNLRPISDEPLTNSSTALTTKLKNIRTILNDPTQALIPAKGGSGGYGGGQQLMKARNPGEARWAKSLARKNLDVRAREAHKTRIGFVNNNQKHFRDPLLQ